MVHGDDLQTIGIDIVPFLDSWLAAVRDGGGRPGRLLARGGEAEHDRGHDAMLARLFTPLFAAMLVTFPGTLLWTGRGVDIERNVLIAFDLFLMVVLGLLMYSLSARDHGPCGDDGGEGPGSQGRCQ